MSVSGNRGVAALSAALTPYRDREDSAGLIAYLMAGYPDEKRFLATARAAVAAGADILEIGVPFSDPVADGKVIQAAGEAAIKRGVTLRRTLAMIKELRAGTAAPLVIMTYLNPIRAMGEDRFIAEALSSGADGVIIPDLVPDEAGSLQKASKDHGFGLVFLAASNSSDDRLALTMKNTSGFLYALALEGVTGEREDLDPRIAVFLERLRRVRSEAFPGGASPALAVGFGVSKPVHFAALRPLVDAVIVGSAVVRRAADSPRAVGDFLRSLKEA